MSGPEATIPRAESVALVLDRLRAGVRQRQAELACLDEQRGDLPAFLAAVRRDATLEEPEFRSEGVGAVRAFVERALYVLFARRQHRALLTQQNRFNRSVELALIELNARNDLLAAELRRAADRHRDDSGPRPAVDPVANLPIPPASGAGRNVRPS